MAICVNICLCPVWTLLQNSIQPIFVGLGVAQNEHTITSVLSFDTNITGIVNSNLICNYVIIYTQNTKSIAHTIPKAHNTQGIHDR